MKRPEGVTMIAVWFFLLTLCCVLGLGGLAIGLISVWTESDAHGILYGTIGMLLAVFAVAAAGFAFAITGWGLWQLKSWSPGVAKVLAILQLIVIPFGTIAGILTLVYLSRNGEARSAFGLPARS
jgi:hypothetical protein